MIYRFTATAPAAWAGSPTIANVPVGRSIMFINMETDPAKVAFVSPDGTDAHSVELIPGTLPGLSFSDQRMPNLYLKGTGSPRVQVIVED